MPKLVTTCLTVGLLGLMSSRASAALSEGDRAFVEKAASGGMSEVQAAQIAQQKSASPQVKQFANRMVTDHTKANGELQQIAQQENFDLPSEPDQHDRSAMQQLSGMTGSSFDQSYAQAELRDHQQDIALFQREAKSGQDPALKQFAQKTLPVLRQHLQLAQALTTNRQ
jgi:putative membrane protein